jgi:hypothetical protein
MKGKGHLKTVYEVPEGEQMYSSTLPSTSELDEVGGQHHAPAALPRRKTRYQLYRRIYGPQGWPHGCGKYHPPPGFNP